MIIDGMNKKKERLCFCWNRRILFLIVAYVGVRYNDWVEISIFLIYIW